MVATPGQNLRQGQILGQAKFEAKSEAKLILRLSQVLDYAV